MAYQKEQEAAFNAYCDKIREDALNAELERLRKENEKLHDFVKDIPTIQVMQKQLADLGSGLCRAFNEIADLKEKLYKVAYTQETFIDEPPTAFRASRNVIL